MNIALKFITIYRGLSTAFRSVQIPGLVYTTCKFEPSCSEYAEISVQKHGAFKGIIKSVKRLSRCHPFAVGGVDYP